MFIRSCMSKHFAVGVTSGGEIREFQCILFMSGAQQHLSISQYFQLLTLNTLFTRDNFSWIYINWSSPIKRVHFWSKYYTYCMRSRLITKGWPKTKSNDILLSLCRMLGSLVPDGQQNKIQLLKNLDSLSCFSYIFWTQDINFIWTLRYHLHIVFFFGNNQSHIYSFICSFINLLIHSLSISCGPAINSVCLSPMPILKD